MFGQETGPGEGHEAAKLGPLLLVIGVVDVGGSVLHQEGGELEQQDAHGVLRERERGGGGGGGRSKACNKYDLHAASPLKGLLKVTHHMAWFT